MKREDFLVEREDFLMEREDFLMEREDFFMERASPDHSGEAADLSAAVRDLER